MRRRRIEMEESKELIGEVNKNSREIVKVHVLRGLWADLADLRKEKD